MSTTTAFAHPHAASAPDARIDRLAAAGILVLRYGLVLLLLMWGAFKFTSIEAEGIKPLIENSPLMSWLYRVLSIRAASALIGIVEMTAGALIATRPWLPRVSGTGSLAAVIIFFITLSFLFSTPGALAQTSPIGGFLMKDVMLLGAALFTAAEAFRSAPR